MAKSARLHELEEPGQTKAGAVSANFWEHWFQAQSSSHAPYRSLDEHTVWEKAINFGFLAADKAKG
jgi:hypothetical protein